MAKMITHSCRYCKKEFQVRAVDHNRGKGKFCSISCSVSLRNAAGYPNRKMPDMKGPNNPAWRGGISKEHYRYKKIQAERYPERIKARGLVAQAIKSGKLQRQPCCVCQGAPGFAHHHDYDKPLEVTWLCRKHHHEEHNKELRKAI